MNITSKQFQLLSDINLVWDFLFVILLTSPIFTFKIGEVGLW